MRLLRWFVVLITIAALMVLGYGWQFGGWRIQRDAEAYAEHVMTCTAFDQSYPVRRVGEMNRSVLGEEDGVCRVRMDVLGGEPMNCRLVAAERTILADGIRALATDVDFFGNPTSFVFSSSNPDPMTELINGPACTDE